jgi:hypothetical protein
MQKLTLGLLILTPLLSAVLLQAQSSLCTPEGITTAYADVVASGGDVENWWRENYASSNCPESIQDFAYNLSQVEIPTVETATSSAITNDILPGDFRLETPGVYLVANGLANSIPYFSEPYLTQAWEQHYFPQTLDRFPVVLMWSSGIDPQNIVLARPVGNIGAVLEEADSGSIVINQGTDSLALREAGMQFGDILFAVNGIEIDNSIDVANSLLQGDMGTSVDITYFRGTEQHTVRIERQFADFQRLNHIVERWDENTILVMPATALELGKYCYIAGSTWCFEVSTQIEPTPVPSPTITPSPTPTNAPTQTPYFENNAFPFDINMRGSIAAGQTVQSNVDTFVDDGWVMTGVVGWRYIFEVSAVESDFLDTEVALYDTSGAQLGYNDDVSFGTNTNSRLEVTIPYTGEFIIGVSAVGSGGAYTLSVSSPDVSTPTPAGIG